MSFTHTHTRRARPTAAHFWGTLAYNSHARKHTHTRNLRSIIAARQLRFRAMSRHRLCWYFFHALARPQLAYSHMVVCTRGLRRSAHMRVVACVRVLRTYVNNNESGVNVRRRRSACGAVNVQVHRRNFYAHTSDRNFVRSKRTDTRGHTCPYMRSSASPSPSSMPVKCVPAHRRRTIEHTALGAGGSH